MLVAAATAAGSGIVADVARGSKGVMVRFKKPRMRVIYAVKVLRGVPINVCAEAHTTYTVNPVSQSTNTVVTNNNDQQSQTMLQTRIRSDM